MSWRQGHLVSSEYIQREPPCETTWAARNYMAFVTQRISVAAHISLAQEIAEALGFWPRLTRGSERPSACCSGMIGLGAMGSSRRRFLYTYDELVGLRY